MLVLSLIFISLPIFVIAFLAQYFLAVKLQWFSPTVGGGDNDWGGTSGCPPSCWA